MSKSVRLPDNTYLDTRGIVHNKKLLSDKLEEYCISHGSNPSSAKWQKVCNIKFTAHQQGLYTYMKIFISNGNNGRINQNAYIDLIMQMGWDGSDEGRAGCNAELHPFLTGFTTSNTNIKVIANSNIDYDIWVYVGANYCSPNYFIHTNNTATVTRCFDTQDNEPTGTLCNLSYTSV